MNFPSVRILFTHIGDDERILLQMVNICGVERERMQTEFASEKLEGPEQCIAAATELVLQ